MGERDREVISFWGDTAKTVTEMTVLNSDFVRYAIGSDTYSITNDLKEMEEMEDRLGEKFDKIYEVNGVFIGAMHYDKKGEL